MQIIKYYHHEMKKILSFLFGLLGLASMASAQSDSIRSVSAREFAQLIKADSVCLIDVRTEEEFDAGHIEKAKNIDVLKGNFEDIAVSMIPKYKIVAVYCRSGKRSLKAAGILIKDGYKVVNLRGGWIEWEEYNKKK